MKLRIEFDTLSCDPNLLGELLRDKFFDQDDMEGSVGCYTTFKLRPDVKELPDMPNEEEPSCPWHCAELYLNDIRVEMSYYWEGDGTLMFVLPDCIISNDDCKKDYGWERDV